MEKHYIGLNLYNFFTVFLIGGIAVTMVHLAAKRYPQPLTAVEAVEEQVEGIVGFHDNDLARPTR